MLQYKRFAGLCAALMLLAGCSTNPATGRNQINFLPAGTEASIGAQQHPQILEQFGGVYEQGALNEYITGLGSEVAANSDLPNNQFQFFLLDSEIVNAMALPGGYIYVTRGLVALANTEAELAAALGHEVGHVTARHAGARITQSVLWGLGAAVVADVADTPGASDFLNLGAGALIASYSRGQENEADMLGVRYASATGHDPRGMGWMLTSLAREDAWRDAGDGNIEGEQFSFMQSHPLTSERIAHSLSLANAYPATDRNLGRERLLQAMDGMIWGENPSQGIYRDHVFAHPDLGFRFEVPEGYELVNQPQRVLMLKENGPAMIFDIRASDLSPTDYLDSLVAQRIIFSSVEKLRVDGHSAAIGTARLQTSNGGEVILRLLVVEWQDGQLYRLALTAPSPLEARWNRDFIATVQSLRSLRDNERGDFRAYRIRLHRVRQGETLANIAARTPVEENPEALLRLLNAIDVPYDVEPGMLIKTVGY